MIHDGMPPSQSTIFLRVVGLWKLQEGCEFLFGVTIDGRLNLRDAYVMDFATGVYAQPTIHPRVPDQPHLYQEFPWTEKFDGDVMMQKDPWEKVPHYR
jgi:hypothetical protein